MISFYYPLLISFVSLFRFFLCLKPGVLTYLHSYRTNLTSASITHYKHSSFHSAFISFIPSIHPIQSIHPSVHHVIHAPFFCCICLSVSLVSLRFSLYVHAFDSQQHIHSEFLCLSMHRAHLISSFSFFFGHGQRVLSTLLNYYYLCQRTKTLCDSKV